jgi:hypothetical protein
VKADELVPPVDVRRDRGDAEGEGSLPVGIDGGGESVFVKHAHRIIYRKSRRFGNELQLLRLGDVASFDEVGTKDGVAKGVAAPQLFRPFAQLLGAAAVEDTGVVTQGQPYLGGDLPQPDKGIRDVQPPGEKIRKLHTLFRNFRVQGEDGPPGRQPVLPAQLLDTDRIEIAPGSDVVEEDLQGSHGLIVADTVWNAIEEQVG